jgi:hypothetical protein
MAYSDEPPTWPKRVATIVPPLLVDSSQVVHPYVND